MKATLIIIAFILGAISADSTIVGKSAFTFFQAAAYGGQNGTIVSAICDGDLVVDNINNGDYVWYFDVDFGTVGAEAIEITFSNTLPRGSTGTASVRLDSVNGPIIADITIGTTVDECTFYTLPTILKSVPTGVHNVYFYFDSPSSTNLMYFYKFRFMESIY